MQAFTRSGIIYENVDNIMPSSTYLEFDKISSSIFRWGLHTGCSKITSLTLKD